MRVRVYAHACVCMVASYTTFFLLSIAPLAGTDAREIVYI